MQGVLDFRFLSRYIDLPEKIYGIRRLVWILGILLCIVIGASFAVEKYYIAFGLFAVLLGIGISLLPYIGALLFLTLIYARPQDYLPILRGRPIILVLMAVTLASWLLRILILRQRRFVKAPHNAFLLGLMLVAMLSSARVWMLAAKDSLIEFGKFFLAYFLIANLIDTRRKFAAALWIMLAGTVYISVLGIFQHYGIAPEIAGTIPERNFGRVQGFGIFDNPNYLAYGVVFMTLFALHGLYYLRSWLGRILLLSVIIVSLYCIYLTRSRGGMLCIILAFFFCVLQGRKLRTILIGGLISIIIFIALIGILPRLSTIRYYQDDGAAMGRVYAWEGGFSMLLSSPLLGVGHKQFTENWERSSHNSFVQVGSELGLIGLFIWIGLLYWTNRYLQAIAQDSIRMGSRWQRAYTRSLRAALVAYVIGSCFAALGHYMLIYIFHTLAVVAGQLYLPGEKRKEINQIRSKDILAIGGTEALILCTWYVFPKL